jgi:hypothetical protein
VIPIPAPTTLKDLRSRHRRTYTRAELEQMAIDADASPLGGQLVEVVMQLIRTEDERDGAHRFIVETARTSAEADKCAVGRMPKAICSHCRAAALAAEIERIDRADKNGVQP